MGEKKTGEKRAHLLRRLHEWRKPIRKFVARRGAAIWLVSFFVVFAIGFSGYTTYYKVVFPDSASSGPDAAAEASRNYTIYRDTFRKPFYSTLRLFTFVFDAEPSETLEKDARNDTLGISGALMRLRFARAAAPLLTGIALLSLVSTYLMRVWRQIAFFCWKLFPKKLLLIGGNEENIRLFHSAESRADGRPMILTEPGKDIAALRGRGLRFYDPQPYADSASNHDELEELLEELLEDALNNAFLEPGSKLTIVINTQDERCNMHLCGKTVACIRAAVEKYERERQEALEFDASYGQAVKCARAAAVDAVYTRAAVRKNERKRRKAVRGFVDTLERVEVVVLGSKRNQELYYALEDQAYGRLRYTDKYHLASFEFVSQYPLTRFMEKDMLESSGCVDKDADFHVMLIGFGRTNQEIFRDLISSNQLMTREDGGFPTLKQVDYTIFDKKKNVHEKLLNHTYFRYTEGFYPKFLPTKEKKGRTAEQMLRRENYLPLAPLPAQVHFKTGRDVNDETFFDEVREICMRNRRSVNYILVAIGDDFENMDLAQHLAEKKAEWELTNLHIFAKVREARNERLGERAGGQAFTVFGNEELTMERLLHNEIEQLSFDRKVIGNRENNNTYENRCDLYHRNHSYRESSVYNILALRLKLQLMGLDYVPADDPAKAVKENRYNSIYRNKPASGDTCGADDRCGKCQNYRNQKDGEKKNARKTCGDFRRFLDCSEEIEKGYSPRGVLAVQEHYRWNAYMIGCGFLPLERKRIFSEKSLKKDYQRLRVHACLCGIEGLYEMGREGIDASINRDFKLMDEAWELLNNDKLTYKYKIVRRN